MNLTKTGNNNRTHKNDANKYPIDIWQMLFFWTSNSTSNSSGFGRSCASSNTVL